MITPRLDDLDRKIIATLGMDARVSNRQIAATIGVTEGTIRTRLKSLQNAGLLQFTVVTDFRLAGSPNLVFMGIHAEPAKVSALAQQLADIDEIGSVIILLGRYNLLAMGLFTTIEDVYELVRSRIKPLPGVRRVAVSVSIHNLKYDVRMARITARPKAAAQTLPSTKAESGADKPARRRSAARPAPKTASRAEPSSPEPTTRAKAGAGAGAGRKARADAVAEPKALVAAKGSARKTASPRGRSQSGAKPASPAPKKPKTKA
jgi:Lrp/AsnC family transcriptional regulator for asnA, asnC and gidA